MFHYASLNGRGARSLLGFVKFADSATSAADDWFAEPIQIIPVKIAGPWSSTADGACEVHFDNGTVAYVKPRQDVARNLTVAREKIAADLAHLLKLPVAPVVVRAPDPDSEWPHYSAMSLACLRAGRLWASGGDAHLEKAAPALEGLRVFWTWIADVDHNGHGQNLLYEVRADACPVVAIDHSYSLGHGNQGDNPLAVAPSTGYGTAGRQDCQAALLRTVLKITSLDWDCGYWPNAGTIFVSFLESRR